METLFLEMEDIYSFIHSCRIGNIHYICGNNGELAQLARALAWHARGHEFDSRILHKNHRAEGLQSKFLRPDSFQFQYLLFAFSLLDCLEITV